MKALLNHGTSQLLLLKPLLVEAVGNPKPNKPSSHHPLGFAEVERLAWPNGAFLIVE